MQVDPLCINCGHRYSLHVPVTLLCIQNPGCIPEVVLTTTFVRDDDVLDEAPVIDFEESEVS